MIRQQSTNKLRIAVLVSGSGTNLQALLDRSATGQFVLRSWLW